VTVLAFLCAALVAVVQLVPFAYAPDLHLQHWWLWLNIAVAIYNWYAFGRERIRRREYDMHRWRHEAVMASIRCEQDDLFRRLALMNMEKEHVRYQA
jgi:hypothetical protein